MAAVYGETEPLWTTPADEAFSFSNFPSSYVSTLKKDCCPFLAIVLCHWDNVLGPKLDHVWRGSGEEKAQEQNVKYVVSRTLNGELLRDAPDNVVDNKLFVLKDRGIVCYTSIFTGRDKNGSNISGLSFLVPYSHLKEFLPFLELIEERVKILIARLRVLQTKDLPTSIPLFSTYLPSIIQTITRLQAVGVPEEIPLVDTAFGARHGQCFDPTFLRRAITSHLQTFGSTMVVGKSVDNVKLMVNTLALFLSPEERHRSRYPMEIRSEEEPDSFDPDLFVQGLLKGADGSFSLSVKGIITSLWPSTLVDVDSAEVKQTYPYHEHTITRQEFLDLELTLMWEGQEGAPAFPSMGLFHSTEEIAVRVQSFMSDINLLPSVCGVREGFIADFLRILDRKALSLIKYVEARTNEGSTPLDHSTVRQLRHDLQLPTGPDYDIVLVRAEKLKPGVLPLLMVDPRRSASRVQELLESL